MGQVIICDIKQVLVEKFIKSVDPAYMKFV